MAAPSPWTVGDGSGLRFPADVNALRDGGIRFLTKAFHGYGSLPAANEVVDITKCDEVGGGSTGRKMLLTVGYRTPGPHRELFVKFSRDFDDPQRDHGRTQMAQEIAFARLSRADRFPVVVPTVLFADYHRASGTGVLITERIPFGRNGIEVQYDKCMDYAMPDQLGHYRAVLSAVARLAGTHAAGRIPNDLSLDPPTDLVFCGCRNKESAL